MPIINSLIEAYGLNSPGTNLFEHAGNHDYSGFYPANQTQNIQINYDNINNYIHITQDSSSTTGVYRYIDNIEPGKIYNLSFYVYSEYSGTLRNCFETSTEIYGSNLIFNSNEWSKCWVTSKAVNKSIVFYVRNTSFKIRNIKLTECSEKDCYFFQYTDVDDAQKPFIYNFVSLQENCRYTDYFTNENPINELISWDDFKYPLQEYVQYEDWQYSSDKSYRTRDKVVIQDFSDGSNIKNESTQEREDATIEYGDPQLFLSIDDIPASGGTISSGEVSYGQTKSYIYSDARFDLPNESGVITEGLEWSEAVSAPSLGTTIKDRSIVGSLTVTATINGKTESTTVDVYQEANAIESYGTPTGRVLKVDDIPASGGSISMGVLSGTITQSCVYTSGVSGVLNNPTVTSSSYSDPVSATSLGTTIKDRTVVGTLTYSYVCNKQTGSVTVDVYQEANEVTSITYGNWIISISANRYTNSASPAPASGGTATITRSASRSRTQNYTSGATSSLSAETAVPTLSVSGAGFTLSNNTVTIASRGSVEGAVRSAKITATYEGVSKSTTLYQEENKITGISIEGAASYGTVMNIPAAGGAVTWTPTVEYTSGSSVVSPDNVNINYSLSLSSVGASQSNNITTWANRTNILGIWRGVTVIASVSSDYTTTPVTVRKSTGQNLNTITAVNIVNSSGNSPSLSYGANGGTENLYPWITYSSGYKGFNMELSELAEWTISGTGFSKATSTASSSIGIKLTVQNRTTNIGNSRSGTISVSVTDTVNDVTKEGSITVSQSGNYVSSINVTGLSFSYPNISAGATSAIPTLSDGSVIYTFSSGSTSTTAPSSTYGSYSVVTTYSLGSVINGFTAVNSSSGVLTATSRGTTIGPARTSGIVTRTTTGTWTPSSSYNSAGTKTDTDMNTARCTQALNKVTAVTASTTMSYPNQIPAAGGTSTPVLGSSAILTFSSGSKSSSISSGSHYGGTLSATTSYSTPTTAGFSINKSNGVVTASPRGTTAGNARSVTVTKSLTYTFTNPSSVGSTVVDDDASTTAACTQEANTQTTVYDAPTVTLKVSDIPASGGTVSSGTVTYSQKWRYSYTSGATVEQTAKTTGGSTSYSTAVTAPSLGTTIKSRASVGTLTATVTMNGKSGSGSATVYQSANTIESLVMMSTVDTPAVTSISASGGSLQYSMDCVYTSGSRAHAGGTFSAYINYAFDQSWGVWQSGGPGNFGYLDVSNRGRTVGAARSGILTGTISGTINGVAINKSCAITLTQALNTITSITVASGSGGSPQHSVAAKGGTAEIFPMFTFSSGSSGWNKSASQEGTWSGTATGFTASVFEASGSYGRRIVAANRGTTIDVARSIVSTFTLNTTINGVAINKSASHTLTQALNKVVSVTETSNSLSYPNIAAAGGTSTPSSTATARFTYSSGATGNPSGYTSSSSFSMTSGNGFSINTSSGVVTASNNTTASSRTSNTITRTIVFSYTNPSSVGGGTVSETITKTATCTQSAGVKTYANPVVSLSYATIPAKGGTVNPTLSYSQTWGWNGATSGGGTITSGGTVRYSGTSVNTTSGAVTAASKGTTISNATTVTTATVTVTLNGKSGTKSATVKQSGNYVTGLSIEASDLAYSTISAGATSASPTMSGGSITFTYSSGSTSGDAPAAAYGSLSTTRKYTLGSVVNGFTAVNSSTGVLTATSRGTTIGAARTSGVVTYTVTRTWTPTAETSAAGKKTATDTKTATCTQALNKVTALAIIPSAGAADTTSYPSGNFAASGGTKTPTKSERVIGTFSSGSQGYTGTSGAWYGGTLTMSRSWSMATATGFSMNTSTGAVTASNRGTTIGAARTCNPKCVISGSFTNPSSVGGTVVNATSVTDSITLTQALNTVTSSKIVPMSGSASDVNFPASGASKGFVGEMTLSSGSKIQGSDYRNYITFSLTSTFGTWIPNAEKYYGIVSVASRGTVIGSQKSGTLTHKISGTINGVSVDKTCTLALTQAANAKSYEYSNLVGHIASTTWSAKSNYTTFWATGNYTEVYTSGATGASGTGTIPWTSVSFGGAAWISYNEVSGTLVWADNDGPERSTTIKGTVGSWTYTVDVTQKAGMVIGRLYLHITANIGYVDYWNITVNSTSGGEIWTGSPDQYGSANNILKMPEECAIIVAQNGGTVTFSASYSTATDRTYRGSISGTEQDRLANGEDITVYLT